MFYPGTSQVVSQEKIRQLPLAQKRKKKWEKWLVWGGSIRTGDTKKLFYYLLSFYKVRREIIAEQLF